jgi:hypothetical protein
MEIVTKFMIHLELSFRIELSEDEDSSGMLLLTCTLVS